MKLFIIIPILSICGIITFIQYPEGSYKSYTGKTAYQNELEQKAQKIFHDVMVKDKEICSQGMCKSINTTIKSCHENKPLYMAWR